MVNPYCEYYTDDWSNYLFSTSRNTHIFGSKFIRAADKEPIQFRRDVVEAEFKFRNFPTEHVPASRGFVDEEVNYISHVLQL